MLQISTIILQRWCFLIKKSWKKIMQIIFFCFFCSCYQIFFYFQFFLVVFESFYLHVLFDWICYQSNLLYSFFFIFFFEARNHSWSQIQSNFSCGLCDQDVIELFFYHYFNNHFFYLDNLFYHFFCHLNIFFEVYLPKAFSQQFNLQE